MKSKTFFLSAFFVLLIFGSVTGQKTQTLRGTVTDDVTGIPLPGATVVIVNSNPVKGTVTDINGKFRFENLPLGRYGIKVSFIGYQDKILNNLELFSGRELVLNITLTEKVVTMDEVVIKPRLEKELPLNDFATVSARTFSIEETQRYAGSLGDPSRMVQNFAGVVSAGDQRNDIIIRGNSPMGLLWRMEGIDIPNPNHFGASGTTGGPVTMLNNNLLTNSDFFTGAFPAEYGNAVSGVFDLEMRNGNNESYEFTGQIGFNGFELEAEGPFSKKNSASFLADYRYSTLAVFDAIGLKSLAGSSVPQYQDFTFKINMPTKNAGRWVLFGIGGTSFIQLWDSKKDEDDATYGLAGTDTDFGSDMGVVGLYNVYYLSKKTKLKTALSASGTRATTALDSLVGIDNHKQQFYRSSNTETTVSLSSHLTHKFSSRNILKAGIIVNRFGVRFIDSVYRNETDDYFKLTDTKGNMMFYEAYAQWKHRFSDVLSLLAGSHFQYFGLNGSNAVEPRLGLEWNFAPSHTLSLGYGLQSQTQPKIIYFTRTELPDGTIEETNRNLGFTESNQFVLGYQYMYGKLLRFKTEVYYQKLSNAPVSKSNPDYSVLNEGAYFYITQEDSLVNKGRGRNYGIEFTAEKFLDNNYYFLTTVSLFRSLYKGYNGIEHPTAFDNKFVVNMLGGYELRIKTNRLNFDLRGVWAGGKPYTPINVEESEKINSPVYDYSKSFSLQHPDYIRIDLKISFRLNRNKTNQEWALEIQNITNRKNIFQEVWDPLKRSLKTDYQQGFFPMFLYRIYF
jgi:hypothetical protein